MECHDTRQQNVAVSKEMILLLGEGALFPLTIIALVIMLWTIDTSLFSLWTSLSPTKTRSGPSGGLSSHGCISQNEFQPKRPSIFPHSPLLDQSTSGGERAKHCGSGCHRWFPWDIDIDKHCPGVQLCHWSMDGRSCSLLGLRDSWWNPGLITVKHKWTANAWEKVSVLCRG